MPLKTGASFLGSSELGETRAQSATMMSSAAHAERVLSYVAELREGNVLNGKYRIEHQIGAGGMGAVYAARHVELGTKFAIKVLLPGLLGDHASVARFAREARPSSAYFMDFMATYLPALYGAHAPPRQRSSTSEAPPGVDAVPPGVETGGA